MRAGEEVFCRQSAHRLTNKVALGSIAGIQLAPLALAFTLGIVCLHSLATLPSLWWSGSALLALGLISMKAPWRWLGAAIFGFCWALIVASHALSERWPARLDGASVTVIGTVASLPEINERVLRFDLAVERIIGAGAPINEPDLVRLSWYEHFPAVQPGERWRLPVKLRTPHGYFNPGGFDYEGWLFRDGIDATGYVDDESAPLKLNDSTLSHVTSRWRAEIAAAMHDILPDDHAAALLVALAVADTRGITDSMWQALNRTGTSHLIAISGMHIALVCGFGLLIGANLARLFPRLLQSLPARHWGALFGVASAFCYAALAGFVLPTRRALVMVSVFLIATLVRRNLNPTQGIALALIAVLILDPMAPLSPGFWLSFLAVAVLIAAFSGRHRLGWLRSLTKAQWMVSLALLPAVVVFFGRISLIGPAANLIAIPLVEFVAVPLVLTGLLLLPAPGPLAAWCLQLAHGLLAAFWNMIAWLASQSASSLQVSAPEAVTLILALTACCWLLSPRGVPGRALGCILLLPLAAGLTDREAVPLEGFDLSVLDVGQGLSVAVRTNEHVLIYDTGPRFRSGFNTGSAVLVPYLRSAGIDKLSGLIISHGDSDHDGGVQDLVAAYPPVLWLNPDPERGPNALPCLEGRTWTWDGVTFEILHPPRGLPYLGNNSSCVLKISSAAGTVLLSGDIEQVVERRLVATQGLKADVLIAPHHGSKSSSSQTFIDAVDPEWVVFSAGFNNRFDQPASEVAARYRASGASSLNTAAAGMIYFAFRPGVATRSIRYRVSSGHYWNQKSAALMRR